MGMFHTCRDSQRRIAGTCAGQGIGRKMGAAFKRDNPELLLPRAVKALSSKDSLRIGICWVFLTIAFEFVSGLAGGSTITELLASYNPMTGNLWLLVLAATLLSPAAVRKITRRRHQ